MFKIKIFKVDTINFKNQNGEDKTYYKLWFLLDNDLAFLTSSKPYKVNDDVTLKLCSTFSKNVYENLKLGLKIAD